MNRISPVIFMLMLALRASILASHRIVYGKNIKNETGKERYTSKN
jgi:hypothetical protein